MQIEPPFEENEEESKELSLIHILNRANEVRPIFRSLGDIAQATGCAIVLIGHLNKAAGTQSTYRGLEMCIRDSSLSIAPRLTKRHETAWS